MEMNLSKIGMYLFILLALLAGFSCKAKQTTTKSSTSGIAVKVKASKF